MLEERNNNVKYDNNINHDTNALDRYKEILESKSEGAQNKSLKGKSFQNQKI